MRCMACALGRRKLGRYAHCVPVPLKSFAHDALLIELAFTHTPEKVRKSAF